MDAAKRCGRCGKEKPLDAFARHRRSADGRQPWCRECKADHQRGNPNREVYRETYMAKNPQLRGVYHKRWSAKLRQDVLEAYGRECSCCGERREEFLTLDHIGGRDDEHRGLKTQQVYQRVRAEGFPKDKYRLLCWNCNCARGMYGYCPHEIEGKVAQSG